MKIPFRTSATALMTAALALPSWEALSAQQQAPSRDPAQITVTGAAPSNLVGMTEGPEVEGIISARHGGQMQVTAADGASTAILVSEATKITASGGFLGLNHTQLSADSLLDGLPVTVKTVQ